MSRVLFSIIFLVLVSSQVTFRLNTKETPKLNVDSSITSTLGLFKATLRKINCSLEVSFFNDTTYVVKGTYTAPNITQDCSYIQVIEGALVTSQNQTFMYVGDSFNESTIFTIDDLGVMRLIGTYIKSTRVDQQSFQTSITQFYTAHKYIYAGSQLNVRFQNTYGPLVNDKGWGYAASLGQLDLYYDQDPSKNASYVYSRFKFNNSQIQDFNSNSFPGAIFSNITFQPRCFEPRIYLNFKAPYIIMAHQYFPKLTVLEQGGYKVFEFIYAKKSQFTYQQEKWDVNYWRQFSLCPEETFQHKGQCLTQCPAPYFHEMRGRTGTCRLVCEEYTPIDLQNRICTCMSNYEAPKYNSEIIKPCPNDTLKYPYGCYCNTSGKFFDKKISYSCVDTCPDTTFAHQGLCVNCPNNCITCGIDLFSRMFLECKICQTGYKLNDGQCFKECNTNLGYSLMANGTCVKCADGNCVNCSIDPSVCFKCGLLYTLNNGSCLESCPVNTTTLVPAAFFQSECLPMDKTLCNVFLTSSYKTKQFLKCDECVNASLIPHQATCVTSCPSGYKRYENVSGFYYCSCKQGRTVGNDCLNISACPIKMYYDVYSDSCLSCPFGCITCRGTICTGCSPGYFLYVSPQVIMCRRKSPLFACNEQYALWNEICLVTDFQNLQMALCRDNVPNCRVCPFKAEFRTTICVVCELGYYLHENKCLSQCPDGTTPYANSVCILTEIVNCSIPHLQSQRQASIVNISIIEKNKAYGYYIFNSAQYSNDPVGYIPYFQKLTNSRRLTDGLYRENSFFQPQWVCLKCNNGYGLSPDFKSCLPCPSPCITCYLALNTSCLTKTSAPTPTSTCQGYIQFQTKQCIKSCNSTDSFPTYINNTLYCMHKSSTSVEDYNRMDSSTYLQPNGSYLTYIFFKDPIVGAKEVNIKLIQPEITVGAASFCKQGDKNCFQDPDSTNPSQMVKLSPSQFTVPIKQGRYIQVLTEPGQKVMVANLTDSISKLTSESGYALPNLVYGSDFESTHPEFMKKGFSYIGQVISPFILFAHCIFSGNELLYKMDNLIILGQTMYFFSFTRPLMGDVLAQFYYGWKVLHIGFFPSFFPVPDNYRQNAAPVPYKLATTDANFLRNAGYSISFLIVFVAAWAIITYTIYRLSIFLWEQRLWHPIIAKSSIIAGVQIVTMNLIYWAVAHFQYRGSCDSCDSSFHNGSLAAAIIFFVLVIGYAIVRTFFNEVGGMYMFKRILIAIIMACSFDRKWMLAPLCVVEGLFTAARYWIEEPQSKIEKIIIGIECGLIAICYCTMFLSNDLIVIATPSTIIAAFSCIILFCDIGDEYTNSQGLMNEALFAKSPEQMAEEKRKQEEQRLRKYHLAQMRFEKAMEKNAGVGKKIWLFPQNATGSEEAFHPPEMSVPRDSLKPNPLAKINDAYENKALDQKNSASMMRKEYERSPQGKNSNRF